MKGSDVSVHSAIKRSDVCHVKGGEKKTKNPNRFESLHPGSVNVALEP